MLYHNTHSSEIFPHSIKLYRILLTTDTTRNLTQQTLDLVGQFKASIETTSHSQPTSKIANICYIAKISLRASQFYRHYFNTNNFIEYDGQFMRISNISFNRQTGITQCMCYHINPENLGNIL